MSYIGRVEQKASDIRRFNVTGSTSATHTLTWTAPNEQSLIITINGVKQQEDAYSVSGTTLTLTSALVSTDKMEVVGILDIGEAVTPPDDSVSTIKIQDDAVTADKLANSINTEIAANTAKVTNATHTGDVTGDTALTIASGAVDLAMLSATGTASSSTFLRGDNAWAAAGGGLNSVQTFTSSGTWTRPSGVTKVVMEIQGAGGSGAGKGTSYYATGGGGGGYAKKFLDVSSISTSTITIGAGASGGTATNPGTAGGDSSWADGTNTITGSGGAGGQVYISARNGGAGGTATGGDVNIRGGNAPMDGGNNYIIGQPGGGAFLGQPAGGEKGGGDNGGDYGGGGGAPSANSPQSGGAAGSGIVIVWEYK